MSQLVFGPSNERIGPTDPMVDLRIPSEPCCAQIVRKVVILFARHHHVPQDDLEKLLTALGEALANAIEHGRAARPIRVRCRIDREHIVATVSDCGVGFRPAPSMMTTLPDPMTEGGRGLPLMRRCSDIFNVRSSPGRGTTVRVGRRLLSGRRLRSA
ncbi:MAG TPA: ATP-binding protein [Candidatus Acidoferrales bacterium]|nr:ATP-binding protein [Candidatus Acidoferrales bacterium]